MDWHPIHGVFQPRSWKRLQIHQIPDQGKADECETIRLSETIRYLNAVSFNVFGLYCDKNFQLELCQPTHTTPCNGRMSFYSLGRDQIQDLK